MGRIVSAVITVFALAGFFVYVLSCPCERVPGLWLTGSEVTQAQDDWGFVNDVGLCELEVRSWRSHSITLNCMASQGDLIISCSRCDGKYWSGVALESPHGEIRIDRKLYPVSLTRVTDAGKLDRTWQARAAKLSRDDTQRPDHWWTFQLASR